MPGYQLTIVIPTLVIYIEYNGDDPEINHTVDLSSEIPGNKLVLTSSKHKNQNPLMVHANLRKSLPNGPYFLSPRTGEIFKAFRVYSDHQLAFTEGAVSDENDGFISLPALTKVKYYYPACLN